MLKLVQLRGDAFWAPEHVVSMMWCPWKALELEIKIDYSHMVVVPASYKQSVAKGAGFSILELVSHSLLLVFFLALFSVSHVLWVSLHAIIASYCGLNSFTLSIVSNLPLNLFECGYVSP